MKSDLQFRSRTPFRRLAVKSHRFRDRESSRISLRKVIQSLKFWKLRSKVKNVAKTQFLLHLFHTTLLVIINCGKSELLKGKQVSSEKRFSNKLFQCFQSSPPASTCSLQLPFVSVERIILWKTNSVSKWHCPAASQALYSWDHILLWNSSYNYTKWIHRHFE